LQKLRFFVSRSRFNRARDASSFTVVRFAALLLGILPNNLLIGDVPTLPATLENFGTKKKSSAQVVGFMRAISLSLSLFIFLFQVLLQNVRTRVPVW
jgi:hypothetical protein